MRTTGSVDDDTFRQQREKSRQSQRWDRLKWCSSPPKSPAASKIVDPEKEQVSVLVLRGETYEPHDIFGVDQTATSVLLSGFAVRVKVIFAAARKESV